MKKRIRAMIGDQDLGFICTFHGFCVQFLKEENNFLHYPKSFTILDEEDQKAILKNVYKTYNIDTRTHTFPKSLDKITYYKTHSDYISKYIMATSTDELLQEIQKAEGERKIVLAYLYEQKKNYGLDFHDLILFSLYILEEDKNVQQKWSKRLQYIMVDEFQDVSERQDLLVTILSKYHKNLFVVGDPDQTIYTWRGANVNIFLNFDKEHIPTKTIYMTTNYRSVSTILNVANSLIEKNEERLKKDLFATKQDNVPVYYNHFKSDDDEAQWICEQILSLNKERQINYSDIAILYRTHLVSRKIEELLLHNQVPYQIYNGIGFYKRKEIKDILSYLRMVTIQDDLSFDRVINVPARNIGEKKMAYIKQYAKQHQISLYTALKDNLDVSLFKKTGAHEFVNMIEEFSKTYKNMSVNDLLAKILDKSGYEAMLRIQGDEERLDNLAELKASVYDYEQSVGEDISLEDYLQKVALYTVSDQDDQKDKIKLMTIHTAKGLEFPYVFLCKFNEGIFPSAKVRKKEELEEERRLAYVAITRAENSLFITDAEGVNYDQSFRYPSRFLFDIKKELLEYIKPLPKEFEQSIPRMRDAKTSTRELKEKLKDLKKEVIHPVFGKGQIVSLDNYHREYIIKFDNIDTKRNISYDFHELKIGEKKNRYSVKLKCIFCGSEMFSFPEENYQTQRREQIKCATCGKLNYYKVLQNQAIDDVTKNVKRNDISQEYTYKDTGELYQNEAITSNEYQEPPQNAMDDKLNKTSPNRRKVFRKMIMKIYNLSIWNFAILKKYLKNKKLH